jgi:hypothetical protein
MFGDNTTDLIGSCMSICTDNRETMERPNVSYAACAGFGCCNIISLTTGRQALTLKLGRRNNTIAPLDEALSSIKVIFSENYDFVTGDLYASWVNTSKVTDMEFDIAITDQPSCQSAQSQVNKDTYACNNESICNDLPLSRGGYNCLCPDQTEGNPYVVDGCIQQGSCLSGSFLHAVFFLIGSRHFLDLNIVLIIPSTHQSLILSGMHVN